MGSRHWLAQTNPCTEGCASNLCVLNSAMWLSCTRGCQVTSGSAALGCVCVILRDLRIRANACAQGPSFNVSVNWNLGRKWSESQHACLRRIHVLHMAFPAS
eukprot:3261787-Amphidinium_carterae.1